MNDWTSKPERSREGDPAPENYNREQDEDAAAQAQSFTEDSLRRSSSSRAEESEKVRTGDISDDVQDLVEHMRQMNNSGRIDMDAYRGEPNFDDNVDEYGLAGKVDRLRGDGT